MVKSKYIILKKNKREEERRQLLDMDFPPSASRDGWSKETCNMLSEYVTDKQNIYEKENMYRRGSKREEKKFKGATKVSK